MISILGFCTAQKIQSAKQPFQNTLNARKFERFACHGWRTEQVRVDWRVIFLKSAGQGQKGIEGRTAFESEALPEEKTI